MHAPAAPGFQDPAGTWNRRFSEPGLLFGAEPNTWLREHADAWAAGQRVLCVADGEGRNSIWLAQRGLQVDAFDISAVGVSKAREWAQREGVAVRFEVASCDDYAWEEGACDGVVAIFVQFADPAMRARMFERMVRALRPGGTLVLQGYTPKQLDYRTGGPGIASHLYTEAMLRDAFGALEIVELREYEAELAEGAGHRGRSALVGLVARKP